MNEETKASGRRERKKLDIHWSWCAINHGAACTCRTLPQPPEPLGSQIDRLAACILRLYPYEPGSHGDESAVDVAIRLIERLDAAQGRSIDAKFAVGVLRDALLAYMEPAGDTPDEIRKQAKSALHFAEKALPTVPPLQETHA
jgi:hypothetical protein